MIIISFSSPGGIFYHQVRMGKNGTLFNLYKLRTMYIDSEINSGTILAEKNGSSIMPEGRVLRKLHLDKIPQLYNVFRGQMSLVGPQPERPGIIEILSKKIPYYTHRIKVKPGITGWAQIKGSYDVSMRDVYIKLQHDFYYIENMSMFLDFKILLLTMCTVLKSKEK